MSAQAAVVAEAGTAHAQQVVILVHARDDRKEEEQKHLVFGGIAARFEQIEPGVRAERIVGVFAAAVDAGKRLFVQEARKPVIVRDLFHRLHDQLILIGRDVRLAEDRRELVLSGRDLVVLSLGGDAELPQLLVEIRHKARDPVADGRVILIVLFLPLGRHRAEQRAPGELEVVTLVIVALVDEEVLLLSADVGDDLARVHAQDVEQPHALTADRIHGFEQRRLFVERLARIGTERRRDAQHRRAVLRLLDERRGRAVPRGVTARLERRPYAAGRKAGRVRLALAQIAAGEFERDLALLVDGNETVVLFGGRARQGLEPMRIVCRTQLYAPLLHRLGDLVGKLLFEHLVAVDDLAQLVVGVLGEILFHHLVVEDIAAVKVGDLLGLGNAHIFSSLPRRGAFT